MRILSLFDGISCGQVALERVGIPIETYYASEIDKYAIQVTQKNYPNTVQLGNINNIDFTQFIGKVDLIIGGSPCTHWSIARGGNNRETTSSGIGWDLFSKYLEAVNVIKPKYFLYENNASMSDNIKNEITKHLGIEPIIIDSSDFSAQIRKRLYWTNISVKPHKVKDLRIKDIIYDDNYKIKNFNKYQDTMLVSSDELSVKWDTSGKGYYSQQNRAKSKELKMNTVTARCVDKCNIWLGGTTFRPIHPIEAERLQTLPDNYTSVLSDAQRYKCIGNGWTVDVIAYIFSFLKE